MHATPQHDFSSRPAAGTTTRATAGIDDTAQPPLTSGFGAVMEQERDIRSATAGYLAIDHGPQSASIDRLLRRQEAQLGANIALLEERYEMLPHPNRFRTLHTPKIRPPTARRTVPGKRDDFLPSLVARHVELLRDIVALQTHRPDGQRGELILAEIARNHEEMAQMLTTWIKEDDSARDLLRVPTTAVVAPAAAAPSVTVARWENEGGSALPDAPGEKL